MNNSGNSPSKDLTKKGWLDYLFYKENNQEDFFLCVLSIHY